MDEKCCKSCCDCHCHHVIRVGDWIIRPNGENEHECCQPEFKKGDWIEHKHKGDWYGLLFIRDIIGYPDHIKCVGLNNKKYTLKRSNIIHHTLTADDLIPCPYCDGELFLHGGTTLDRYAWFHCKNDTCHLSMPYRETVHKAVADVLLEKMRMEACDF